MAPKKRNRNVSQASKDALAEVRQNAIERVAARVEMVNALVAYFEASGVKYTCLAVIHETIKGEVARLLAACPWRDHRIFKPRAIMNAASDEIHRRWQAQAR